MGEMMDIIPNLNSDVILLRIHTTESSCVVARSDRAKSSFCKNDNNGSKNDKKKHAYCFTNVIYDSQTGREQCNVSTCAVSGRFYLSK